MSCDVGEAMEGLENELCVDEVTESLERPLYDVKTTEFVVVLRSGRIGTNRLFYLGSAVVLDGVMVAH